LERKNYSFSEQNNQLEFVLTEEVISGLQYGVGQLAAKSAKLNKTSISESNPAKSSNTYNHTIYI
jgi:hypothetical protein